MFTGLVQELGSVVSVTRRDGGALLTIGARCAQELVRGDSVLVNGVCLTAAEARDGEFAADLSPETVRRSSIGELERGDSVNLELPLRAQDLLGGHLVQGHVDCVGQVESVSEDGSSRTVRVAAAPSALRYVVEKGSVAVDGVSLTVTAVGERSFSVSLVPETLARTNLGDAAPGRRVNLEVDVLAKYLEKLVASGGGP